MHLPSHLHRNQHGVFQIRLVLPALLARVLGQKEIRRSLGIREPRLAKLAAYDISARMLPLIRSLSHLMAIDPSSIDPNSIRELVVENLVIENGVIKASRLETSKDPEVAKRELQALGELAKATLPAEGQSYEYAKREREIFAAAMSAPASVARPKSIGEAVKGFLLFKKDSAPSTLTMYSRRLDVFTALAGGPRRLLHLLTEPEVAEVAEALSVLPSHVHERDIKPAAEMLANPPKEKTVEAGTIRDHLTLFAAFFDWAIRSRHYSGPNPMRDAAKPKSGTAAGGAEPFTQSELELIFEPARFESMKRPHHFWGPLLGLFSGARSNEIAQLRLSDFVEEGGLKCIRITHNPSDGTRTKNPASERILPLHSVLFEIGLKDYLDDLRQIGAERLFPHLPLDKHGKREKYLSRDFNENHLKELGIWVPRRKVFHSFRDTLSNTLYDASETEDGEKGIDPFYVESWLGHAVKDVSGKHYRKPAPPAKLAKRCLPFLGFEFLNFPAIRYEKGQWNEWLSRNICP